MREWENLSRIGEGDGALARAVEGCEKEDEESDEAQVCCANTRDEEALDNTSVTRHRMQT